MSNPTTSTLSEISTLAAAVAGPAGDVGAIAKMVDDGELIYRQAHDEGVVNTPRAKYTANILTYEKICDNPNEAIAGVQLGNFVNSLLVDAGIPVGHVGGKYRRVPVEYFDALVDALARFVCLEDTDAAKTTVSSTTQPTK